jgi:hypothetical protein
MGQMLRYTARQAVSNHLTTDNIGSAYGDQGIWSRWCAYAASGHGGNVELRALVSHPTLDYCRKAFRFALLEARPAPTPDDVILAREAFWKRVLFPRGEQGLNRN